MLSEIQQERLEAFSELHSIGMEYADRINSWIENNVDDCKLSEPISQDMSGDAVLLYYLENGFEEKTLAKMLDDIGYEPEEDSDDDIICETDPRRIKNVSEWLNAFCF